MEPVPPLKDPRQATYWECKTCHYEWWAPAASRCPKCKGEDLMNYGSQELDYVRV